MKSNRFNKISFALLTLIIGFASLGLSDANTGEPIEASFDCTKATSHVEKVICSVQGLADADLEMAALYKCLQSISSGYSSARKLLQRQKLQRKQEQTAWLKMRNRCSRKKNMEACLEASYRERIEVLTKQMKEQNIPSFYWCADEDDRRRINAAPPQTRATGSTPRNQSVVSGNGYHLIGENLGDTFIYTNRETWEKDYKDRALDKTIYRLGNDIVLFVGSKSSGKPDLLEMTPSKNFSQEELKRFTPASKRKDIPSRDHDLFDNMDERGFQHQD